MLFRTSLLFTLLALAKATDSIFDSVICLFKASALQLSSMTLCLVNDDCSYPQYTCTAEVPIARAPDLVSKMDKSKNCTILFVPHYLESLDLGEMAAIINAYRCLGNCTVIYLQYAMISDGPYNIAFCSVRDIGIYVANGLNGMVASGCNPDSIQLAGHSLGAQVAGAIARSTNFTVRRISGLDPAGPAFSSYPFAQSLSSTDAAFVSCVYTDGGGLGTTLSLCHANFYPNNGKATQPGCSFFDILCSHRRAMSYWAEAVANPEAFLARQCDSWDDFLAGLCDSNRVIEMSPNTPTDARGSYFFHTGSESRFGLGADGANG